MKHFSKIETNRLTLTKLSPDQAGDSYVKWLQDPEVTQFLELRRLKPQNLTDIRSYINKVNADETAMLLGIFDSSNQIHIGNVKVDSIDYLNKRCVLGLFIGEKSYWSKGLACEVISGVTEYCFKVLKLNLVEAGAYASNKASIKTFLKSGYIEEARYRNYWEFNGSYDDHVVLIAYNE